MRNKELWASPVHNAGNYRSQPRSRNKINDLAEKLKNFDRLNSIWNLFDPVTVKIILEL